MPTDVKHPYSPAKVLLVTDQSALAKVIRQALQGHGVTCLRRNVDEAMVALRDWRPHLAIVDLDLAAGNPLDQVCAVASGAAPLPVVALTRRGDLSTKLTAFEWGVDDILTVPFTPGELVARIVAVTLRAYSAATPFAPVLRLGDVEIDPRNRRVRVGGRGLYRSGDGGQSWVRTGPVPPPGRVVAAGRDGSTTAGGHPLLLVGDHPPCARGGVGSPLHRSEDGGASWQEVDAAPEIQPLAIWSEPPLALGVRCGGGQLSTDGGVTWQAARLTEPGYDAAALAPLPAATSPGAAALVVGISEGGTGRLWRLDLADPASPRLGELLKQFWGTGSPTGVDQRYVLGTATDVWTSDDGGQIWRQRRRGLEDVTVSVDPFQEPIPDDQRGFGIFAVAIDLGAPDRLYAGTVDGLYESADGGARWRRVAGVAGRVTTLVLAAGGDRLFAETDGAVIVVALQTRDSAHRSGGSLWSGAEFGRLFEREAHQR